MQRGRLSFIKVVDGWLIGRDEGEWGGDLWWYAADGKKHYKISDEQVRSFVQTKEGLFAFEGLAHMGLNIGHILTLNQNKKGRWKSEESIDTKGVPEAFAIDKNGDFLIVTPNRLLRVGQNKKIDVLVNGAFWYGLYINSLVIAPNGSIYIGMVQGVARVRPQEKQEAIVEWLLPNE